MAIPEEILEGWSSQGAIATSRDTYATIRGTLETTPYAGLRAGIYLQGSYGNDTNIFRESDVDVVAELTGNYYYELGQLPIDEQDAFRASSSVAPYNYAAFRADVVGTLQRRFPGDVQIGNKAVRINARNARRNADVLIAYEHHNYRRFYSMGHSLNQRLVGICFFKPDGTQVVNYPKIHSANLTTKHQATGQWLKPLIRIFKNAREHMIEAKLLERGMAPSYYIEGLLYNIPNDQFGTNYRTSVFNILTWLVTANKHLFLCAHEQYSLLGTNQDVTWSAPHCDKFISALCTLWNDWR